MDNVLYLLTVCLYMSYVTLLSIYICVSHVSFHGYFEGIKMSIICVICVNMCLHMYFMFSLHTQSFDFYSNRVLLVFSMDKHFAHKSTFLGSKCEQLVYKAM